MTPDSRKTTDGTDTDHKPLLLLLCEPGRNRELLQEAFEDRYRVEVSTDADALARPFDCCLVTAGLFGRLAEDIRDRQANHSAFLPVVLLVEDDDVNPEVWTYVDDIIRLPASKVGLRARVRNLVERRQTATALAKRERQLAQTVADLRLKEKAIDQAPVGLTIADATAEDHPLVYVNDEFVRMTGYPRDEVLGENCRFLQGEETDEETVGQIRAALEENVPVSVDIINYRKSGEKFWNGLDIAPIRDETGAVTHYVGFQADITERKVEERRQEVLNRVLSHNLRNKMNVIKAYLELLERQDDPPAELSKMRSAVENLQALAETARETNRILSTTNAFDTVVEPEQRLRRLVDSVRDRYGDVRLNLELPEEDLSPVATGGLFAALQEALENAAKHNDSSDPYVTVRAANRGDHWVDIEIEDNGPGIPEQELTVLRHGENALEHADRMGIWLIYWTVTRAGGMMTVSDCDGEGTRITLSVPVADLDQE
jgi:PAS domain S-box-containing protein